MRRSRGGSVPALAYIKRPAPMIRTKNNDNDNNLAGADSTALLDSRYPFLVRAR
jgi:hypothetical protein